jgi:hypothetical protein
MVTLCAQAQQSRNRGTNENFLSAKVKSWRGMQKSRTVLRTITSRRRRRPQAALLKLALARFRADYDRALLTLDAAVSRETLGAIPTCGKTVSSCRMRPSRGPSRARWLPHLEMLSFDIAHQL